MDARTIAERSGDYEKVGGYWHIPCPAHQGEDRNLHIWNNEDGYLAVKCWSGQCTTDEILRALGIEKGGEHTNSWRVPSPTAEYHHPDGIPRHSYRVNYPEHFEYKDRPCSWKPNRGRGKVCIQDGEHKHPYNTKDLTPRGTYMLRWSPDKPENTIVIVEGEKAALALKQHVQFTHNITPVSWYGGSDTWRITSLAFDQNEGIKGREVILWPDNHEVGIKVMNDLARRICREATPASLHIVDGSALSKKDDAADVDYDTAIVLLRSAYEFISVAPADIMAPLLSTATEADLGGGNESIQKLRDEVMRKAAQSIAHRFVSLFGEWFQRVDSAWQVAEEDYIGTELSLAVIEVCGYALSKPQKVIAIDRLKDIVSPPVNNIEILPRWQRESSFNMDTGKLVQGVVYGDRVVSVSDKGEIEYRDINEREFLRHAIGYDLPQHPVGTPLFDTFLSTSLHSWQDGELLKELIGRSLCGRRSEQVFAMLQGPGGSGKGTIFTLLRLLLDRNYGAAGSFEKVAGTVRRLQDDRQVGVCVH